MTSLSYLYPPSYTEVQENEVYSTREKSLLIANAIFDLYVSSEKGITKDQTILLNALMKEYDSLPPSFGWEDEFFVWARRTLKETSKTSAN
jgi:hypothetical protein